MKASMRAADLLGRKFAQAGKPITDCPFDPNGTPEQRAKALRFVQGYIGVKSGLTVNYDGDET